jgi:hypothetical protein
MPRRLSARAAVTAALLVCLGGSLAPAQAGNGSAPGNGGDGTAATGLTGAEWHRLHPLLCHTAGDHQLR